MSPETNSLHPLALAALRRSRLYALAASAFAQPPSRLPDWQEGSRTLRMGLEATASDRVRLALEQLSAAAEQVTDEAGLAELRSFYVELLGQVRSGIWPPYETEFTGGANDFLKNQDLADLMGFYRAFGLDPAQQERPDHIGVELEFMHVLALKEALAHQHGESEQAAVCADAQKKFFRDHLGRWAQAYGAALMRLPHTPPGAFYRLLGYLLDALVEWDCLEQQVEPERVTVLLAETPRPEPPLACGRDCPGGDCSAQSGRKPC